MKEKYREYSRLYDGKYILKFEKQGEDKFISTYIVAKDGNLSLETEVNNELVESKQLGIMNFKPVTID